MTSRNASIRFSVLCLMLLQAVCALWIVVYLVVFRESEQNHSAAAVAILAQVLLCVGLLTVPVCYGLIGSKYNSSIFSIGVGGAVSFTLFAFVSACLEGSPMWPSHYLGYAAFGAAFCASSGLLLLRVRNTSKKSARFRGAKARSFMYHFGVVSSFFVILGACHVVDVVRWCVPGAKCCVYWTDDDGTCTWEYWGRGVDDAVVERWIIEDASSTSPIRLSFHYCSVTDRGIAPLSDVGQLVYLDLRGTQVSRSGAERLQAALPDTVIRMRACPKGNRTLHGLC